jgi:hypothetical protein
MGSLPETCRYVTGRSQSNLHTHIMTVKFRKFEHQYSTSNSSNSWGGFNHRHFYVELLNDKYKHRKDGQLKVFAILKWQTDKENEDKTPEGENPWYGMHYELSRAENHEDIFELAKIAKYIHDNCAANNNPYEVIKVMGGIEHVYVDDNFLPLSYDGYQRFKVLQSNGYTYRYIYAPNEILAYKMHRKSEDNDMKLEFDKVISVKVA